MSEKELRAKVIRLAHSKPELREHLLPLVKSAGGASWLDYTTAWFESLGKQVVNLSAKQVTYKNVSSNSVFFRIRGHKEMAWLIHEKGAFVFSMKGMKEKRYGETISLDYIAKHIANYIDQHSEI